MKRRDLLFLLGLVTFSAAMGYTLTTWANRPKPPVWVDNPNVSPTVNQNMRDLLRLEANQFHWTEDDWALIRQIADHGGNTNMRAQAIYDIGYQAGCDRCFDAKRKAEWEPYLKGVLWNDSDEYVRAAAMRSLFAIRSEIDDLNFSKSESDVLRFTWKMTYGKPEPKP